MRAQTRFTRAGVVALMAFASVPALFAQRGGGQGGFPQPAPAREVTVAAIPGVVADGAKWTLLWGGPDNADGIVGMDDGTVIFAQEQPNRISRIDAAGKVSSFIEDTHGTGAIAIDAKGRVLGAERTCTDPGGKPDQCKEATNIGVLKPEHKTLADNVMGMGLGRVNDLVADKKGGVYFNGTGLYYVDPNGKVTSFGDGLRTNGVTLSRDEKTLYVTNGPAIVAFDVQADGSTTNQREFGKLEGAGGGDGLAIDAEGRLYVSSNGGVQVLGADGKYLGMIPSPRGVISVAFGGRDKKSLYIVGSGAIDAAGKDLRTPDGVRNNAKSVYKIDLVAQGFKGRVK